MVTASGEEARKWNEGCGVGDVLMKEEIAMETWPDVRSILRVYGRWWVCACGYRASEDLMSEINWSQFNCLLF